MGNETIPVILNEKIVLCKYFIQNKTRNETNNHNSMQRIKLELIARQKTTEYSTMYLNDKMNKKMDLYFDVRQHSTQ